MELDSVTRIVDAVGSKYTPANLDRQGLRHDLEWAGAWYRTRVSLGSEAKRNHRIEAALYRLGHTKSLNDRNGAGS